MQSVQYRQATALRPTRAIVQKSSVSSIRITRRQYRAAVSQLNAKALTEALDIKGSEWDDLVLKSEVPVVVDFWAPWCGPCRIIMPLMDELQREYGDKVRVYKVNTDNDPNIATDYGIRSIPTVMIFKGGQKVETIIGAVPKNNLMQSINKYTE